MSHSPSTHPAPRADRSVKPEAPSVSRSKTIAAHPAVPPPSVAAAPATSFDQLGLPPSLLNAVRQMGFTQPTPIQHRAIPVLLEGRDLMASAVTGSGKTAAFLLPIMHRLLDRPRGGTRALILTPTRELAAQILDHFRQLAEGTGLKAAAIFGGVAMSPQVQALRSGTDVLIATPGRLLDHFQYPYAKMDRLECLVLDEADRMLDMGFLPDVQRILRQIPRERQTLLFSATLPAPIMELAGRMLRNPATVHIETQAAPARGITHRAFAVAPELKTRLLLEILKREAPGSVLAFTRTRHRANRLADFLVAHGVSCARIHGSRSQPQRTDALAGFREGRFQVLVATDIAARGIDIQALDLVVNFDVPGAVDVYIHRVGRTARMEATGNAYTLVAPEEENDWRDIERGICRPIPREKLEGFEYNQKSETRFEIPAAERIAAIRARKAEERSRAKAKAERRVEAERRAEAGSRPKIVESHQRPAGRGPSAVRGSGRPERGNSRNRPSVRGDEQPAWQPEADRFRGRGPVAELTLAGNAQPRVMRRGDGRPVSDDLWQAKGANRPQGGRFTRSR